MQGAGLYLRPTKLFPLPSISPKVSILITAYNHGQYIAQCLDSILMQQIDFSFEIVIGEDGSTDDTADICQEYADRHPDIIRLFIRDQARKVTLFGRVTGKFNLLKTMEDGRGEYFAFCDGDDYWTDPLKLQKQVGFLEANHQYSFCATHRSILKDGEIHPDGALQAAFLASGNEPVVINKDNFFSPYLVKSNVILFRRECLDLELMREFYKEVKDTFIYFSLLNGGNGIIQPWNTGVYRIHSGGRWTSLNRFQAARMNHFCIRGMRRSYLGEAPSLRHCYQDTLFVYFRESLRNRCWKDALIAFGENPMVCVSKGLSSLGKRLAG